MSRENNRVVLVTGATGQQGGATARHLLAKGWAVRGLTRNPNSPSAQALAEAGAEVVQGDLGDRASLDRALDGVYGVYSVQALELGVEIEEQQGKALADAVSAAAVEHVVYSSVGGAERASGVPHFESKWQVEEHMRALGLPVTVLRPVYFMENVNWQRSQIMNGLLPSMGLDSDKPLQMIAVNDIGAFAALAFDNPDKFMGRAIEIAGDELTELKMTAVLADVIGRPVSIVEPEGPPAFPDMIKMFEWFNKEGYEADLPALRAMHPTLMTFETWLRQNGWENAQA
jgi:uncharacterized protein YbjT (DUF2867 family)